LYIDQIPVGEQAFIADAATLAEVLNAAIEEVFVLTALADELISESTHVFSSYGLTLYQAVQI
jgi:hypothetical protein